MTLQPGDLVDGKYRVLRLIGDGGMGSVYEARHELLGVPVALKFLHADLAKRPGLAARFLQEARVSATIRSAHVCHVTDVDTASDGSPFLVMELLTGESLQTLVTRRGKLAVDQAVDFGLQILAGLEAAHALGVVHRDLKPDNVFVTPSSSGPLLKLIDFGIAKLKETSEYKKEVTRAGVMMGTPEYMAPEQLYAAHEVDHRADLYSLGVMLFEMLSGARPADGDNAEMIISSIVAGTGKKLAVLEPTLPPALVSVVERALSPDRDRRFPSAYDMRIELARSAGELSHAGRLAAMAAGQAAVVSDTRADDAAPDGKVPDTVDVPKLHGVASAQGSALRGVADTLPPAEGAGARRATGTQAAAPPAAAQGAWVPPTSPIRRPRRSRAWLALVGVAAVLALGVGGLFAAQSFIPGRRTIPELPPFPTPAPPTSATPGTAVRIEPTELAPTNTGPTARPTSHAPTGPATKPQPTSPSTQPGAGGTSGFPLPFPSFALPSSLPPLPSSLPGLPPGFPTALPSFLPQIPGLTLPAAAGGNTGQ
jgi:serine/threonine-protein kinase